MIWLQLTSGRGPGECEIATAGILNVILDEAKASSLTVDVLETEDSEHGYLSALVAVQGEGEETFAQSWKGTIRWICQSPIRKEHRRKNWFVGISVLSPPELVNSCLDSKDLVFESMKASGPGGQNVNNVSTKIRLTHIPSGTIVVAQEERSQHRNKALALARLYEILSNQNQNKIEESKKDKWAQHSNLERGREIRTYNDLDFKRIIK